MSHRKGGRLQPQWSERRNPLDRRAFEDRRQRAVAALPFPDRRAGSDRRLGAERRAVAEEDRTAAGGLLTPEEIRALLN